MANRRRFNYDDSLSQAYVELPDGTQVELVRNSGVIWVNIMPKTNDHSQFYTFHKGNLDNLIIALQYFQQEIEKETR